MKLEIFKVRGFTLEPYFQLYQNLDDNTSHSGELLTRLESGDSAYELISQLTVTEHLEFLKWLVNNSNQLTNKFGLHCSMNIDNNVVVDPSTREEFLRISETSNPSTTFEFTESHAMPSAIEANLMFRQLREQGHRCALDDFGSGLNGMTMLTDYDFDVVKVDRALTLDIEKRPEKLKVLTLLHEMIMALNKSHVVEGIETSEVYDLLVTAGFRVFQGYLLDRPVPLSQITKSYLFKEQR